MKRFSSKKEKYPEIRKFYNVWGMTRLGENKSIKNAQYHGWADSVDGNTYFVFLQNKTAYSFLKDKFKFEEIKPVRKAIKLRRS